MTRIELDIQDCFRVVRSLVYGEIKALRRISDVFGDELTLTMESAFGQAPLDVSDGELTGIARRVAGFFCIPDASGELAPLPTLGDWARMVLEHAGARPDAVTFFTSGSTGEPKPVHKPFFFLEQDSQLLGGMLKGAKRFLALVPPHHIYGFIYTVLIPKALGVECVDMRFRRPAAVVRSLQSGDVVVGIPHVWRQFLETRERFPSDVVGITSTAPCPPEVIKDLRKHGLAVMYEIYGSSESGAMGWRSNPDDPLTIMAAWRPAGEDAFVRSCEDGSDSEPFRFQDQLEWVDEKRFRVKRRLDSAVQVAGINVFPARTAEALRSHEAVADCAVRLMRPEEGDRLKAFVVPKPGVEPGEGLRAELREHLAARLGRLEQPKSITFGDALPRNEMGKLCDWEIKPGRKGTTMEQSLARLQAEAAPIAPDQEFVVDRLRQEDAWPVARLFYSIYGDSFPFEVYYLPERLLFENRRGGIKSVVARTPSGDVIGYGGMYRSSAPYHGVYEIGQSVILPEYRNTRAGLMLQEYIKDNLLPGDRVEAFFVEAPCRNVVDQKYGALSSARESALGLGLMPPGAYGESEYPEDRVSTLLLFGASGDEGRAIHVPEVYRDAVEYILGGLELQREMLPAEDEPPSYLATRGATEYYDYAQVARMHVPSMGPDFQTTLEGFEEQAYKRGARVLQISVNLGESWCSAGVDLLREKGYFLGGLLPRWFDSDGLLLQRVLDLPNFRSVKLYSQRAHRILDLVRRDLESNPACAYRPANVVREAAPSGRLAQEVADVALSGEELTIEEVVAVARNGASARLTTERSVLDRVEASASFIDWAVRIGEPIYGVNTGFGGMANVTIGEQDLRELQMNLLRFLNAGAGGWLPEEDVRAAMLLRVNSHMRGVSGVRRELIDRLMLFLEKGVTPMVRDMGSIGASGDLVPLATIAGAVTGADSCFKVRMGGETISCLDALSRLGLEPLQLGPKEGLGMVNGTSVMTGIAALCINDARRLLALSLAFHAMVIQALQGTNQSFHPFIQKMKPHSGQVKVAELMLELLEDSRMIRDELDGHHEDLGDQPVQDRYSLRCLPQFLGPVLEGLRSAAASVETEMNSANDNPLIDGANCLSYHSGNFLGQYVAVWMDHLRYYLGLTAKHMDAQIALLVAPEFNAGLPASLAGNPARKVNMGLKGLQIAANSIMPMLSYYGAPIADRFPTHAEQFNQNINSQGFNSAVLARKSLDAMESYVAMSLIFGVQAVSLRSAKLGGGFDPRDMLSETTARLYEAVLAALGRVPDAQKPPVHDDNEQSLEEWVDLLRRDIATEGGVVAAVRSVLGGLQKP